MIAIEVNRAIDHESLCIQYAQLHQKALSEKVSDPSKVSTNNQDWFENPLVYLITARSTITGQLIGGVRIHVFNNPNLLPLEKAIGAEDPRIHDLIKNHEKEGGVGELCALWNRQKGLMITDKLTTAALAFCQQLPISKLLCFPGQHMFDFLTTFGFQTELSVGANGEFNYPSPQYLSRIVSLNPKNLTLTSSDRKSEILKLRENPITSMTYHSKGQFLTYDYKLWGSEPRNNQNGIQSAIRTSSNHNPLDPLSQGKINIIKES